MIPGGSVLVGCDSCGGGGLVGWVVLLLLLRAGKGVQRSVWVEGGRLAG